jgi:hypothetical protein
MAERAYTAEDLAEVDRNARAYGYEIGRGHPLVEVIQESDEANPFLDPNWRDHLESKTLEA